MKDYLNFDGEDETPAPDIIRTRKVAVVNSLDELAYNFKGELSKISLEELTEPDLSLKTMVQRIKDMRPNRILLQKDAKSFMLIDVDLMLSDFIVVRGRKLLGTGNLSVCKEIICKQLQKEFPDKTERLTPGEIDEMWLTKFCLMHYGNQFEVKLIKIDK